MNNLDYEKAVRLEDDACAAVKRLAAEIAVACRPISGWGDGNCGSVLDYVTEALAADGLYVDPATRPRPPPSKQVIKQGLRTQVLELHYWQSRSSGDLGVFKTSEEWTEETGLTHAHRRRDCAARAGSIRRVGSR